MTSQSRGLRIAALVLRIVLGAVFVYAAYVKLKAPWQLFAGAIGDYQVLPEWAVIPVARTLPWFELAIGLLLFAGIFLRPVSIAATAVLGVFFALMIRSFAKGMDISCGCFGPTGDPISWKTLVRDGSFLAVSLSLIILSFRVKRNAV
jgi:putative oxidoreductase